MSMRPSLPVRSGVLALALVLVLVGGCREPEGPGGPPDAGGGGVRWVLDESFPVADHVFAAWEGAGGEGWAVGDSRWLVGRSAGRWGAVERPDAPEVEEGVPEDEAPRPPALRAVHGKPGGPVVAVGDAGTVLVREAGPWKQEAQGMTGADLMAVLVVPDGEVWAAGYEGTVLRRSAGSWEVVDAHSVDNLFALAHDGGTVWALGAFGAALRLGAGGWERIETDTGRALAAAWSDGEQVWAVGLEGTFLHWDGAEWAGIDHPFGPYLRALWGRSGSDLFAAGWDGAVLHWDGQQMCDVSPARWRLEAVTGDAETVRVYGVGGRVWEAEVIGPCEASADAGVDGGADGGPAGDAGGGPGGDAGSGPAADAGPEDAAGPALVGDGGGP